MGDSLRPCVIKSTKLNTIAGGEDIVLPDRQDHLCLERLKRRAVEWAERRLVWPPPEVAQGKRRAPLLERDDQRTTGLESRWHRSTLHEDRGVALLGACVDDARLRSKQAVQPVADTLRQRLCIGGLGEGRQQLGNPLVEGVAVLEEHAVDLGAEAVVSRNHDRYQRQREHDLDGRWIDRERRCGGLGGARYKRYARAGKQHDDDVVRRRGAQQAVNVEEVVAHDRDEEAERGDRERDDAIDGEEREARLDRREREAGEGGDRARVETEDRPLHLTPADRIGLAEVARGGGEANHSEEQEGGEQERVSQLRPDRERGSEEHTRIEESQRRERPRAEARPSVSRLSVEWKALNSPSYEGYEQDHRDHTHRVARERDGVVPREVARSADADFDTDAALWLSGQVSLPPDCPADETLEVFALSEAMHYRMLVRGVDPDDDHPLGKWTRERVLARSPVEPDGSFRLPFPEGRKIGHVHLRGRHLYLRDSVQVSLTEERATVSLNPITGTLLRGRLAAPQGAEVA